MISFSSPVVNEEVEHWPRRWIILSLCTLTFCLSSATNETAALSFARSRNSPSGKQYIDNAKHKLIMKIILESVILAEGERTVDVDWWTTKHRLFLELRYRCSLTCFVLSRSSEKDEEINSQSTIDKSISVDEQFDRRETSSFRRRSSRSWSNDRLG